ncbi:MAG: dihydroorotate dehydrogenase [Chloroflexi bacterium]|jgi:dihydroorotate dehydrogenase (NAD+) catalytic subunit|nr:dihydroorotate dehydrogenase [Chloroflexota bacterium]MBT7081557.1 dihydroorotate dehydrogenase [Chloroflexota bacterium]MBT7289021.1 dihydroorotate dehydrogenase [Chloroflexota bacterium]
MSASGTFGYGVDEAQKVDITKLGAVICKGIFLKPRDGNPQPRLVETPAGMLNSIGLQGVGIDKLISDYAPVWGKWDTPVIVNICGESADEYTEIAKRLDEVDGVSGLEVNISCPNLHKGGMEFGTDPQVAAQITSNVKAATSLPVMVKLTPNAPDIVSVARAVADAGADALSLINTIVGMAIDVVKQKPVLPNGIGGLSGPAIKPIALAIVYKVAKSVDIPIIGVGGISSANDALEFILAGASAVQIGTAGMINPDIFGQIVNGIQTYMQKTGTADISELVGKAGLR